MNGVAAKQDYRFTLDQFTVTRNGSVFFEDTFSDCMPTQVGGPLEVYAGNADLFENNGRMILDGTQAVIFRLMSTGSIRWAESRPC